MHALDNVAAIVEHASNVLRINGTGEMGITGKQGSETEKEHFFENILNSRKNSNGT